MSEEISKKVTVDSIREEFRSCMFSLIFQKAMHDVQQTDIVRTATDTIMNIIAFGVNAGIIDISEGEDWRMATTGELILVDVCQKYGMDHG